MVTRTRPCSTTTFAISLGYAILAAGAAQAQGIAAGGAFSAEPPARPAHIVLAQQAISAAPGATAPGTPASTPPAAPAAAAPAGPKAWEDTIQLSAQFEGGIYANGNRPSDGLNFGELNTDRANQAQLNQMLLTVQRPIDSSSSSYDIGFKLQGLYGSDARYLHALGEFNHAITGRYQFTLLEASLSAHLPVLVSGGIDLKAGQFVSPLGFETIDPSTTPFYSHSYIFNFVDPDIQTGGLAIAHVNPLLDLYIGADTGVNTTFQGGDNNAEPGGTIGFGLNSLAGGALTVVALSHLGPENPVLSDPNANGQMRYENDGVLTYKASKKLTFTTELAYIRDDGFHADGYGGSQYVSYALNDTVTLNGRAEVFRDNKGFFVGAYPGNLDYVDAELGRPATVIGAAPTTYSEFTAGITYKPDLPKPVVDLELRPEIRYDRSLNGTRPYDAGRDAGAFTFGGDVIIGF